MTSRTQKTRTLDSEVRAQIRQMNCPPKTIEEWPDYGRLADTSLPPLTYGIIEELRPMCYPPQHVKDLMVVVMLALGFREADATVGRDYVGKILVLSSRVCGNV